MFERSIRVLDVQQHIRLTLHPAFDPPYAMDLPIQTGKVVGVIAMRVRGRKIDRRVQIYSPINRPVIWAIVNAEKNPSYDGHWQE